MEKHNNKLNNLVQSIANPKIIIASFVAFIAVMVLVNIVFKQNFNYLTQTFNYSPQSAYQLLNDIGVRGRSSHLFVLVPDIIMVFLYTVLLVGANYALFRNQLRSCTAITVITFLPVILTITQLIEIVALSIILIQYPNEMMGLMQFTSIITMIKTVLTTVFFLLPIVGLLTLGVKKVAKRA